MLKLKKLSIPKIGLLLLFGIVLAFSLINFVSQGFSVEHFMSTFIFLGISLGSLFMLIHMPAALLIEKVMLKKTYTSSNFKALRQKRGKPENASAEENGQSARLIKDAIDGWTGTSEDGAKAPRNMGELSNSLSLVSKAAYIMPTDGKVIEDLNGFLEQASLYTTRIPRGSFKIIGFAVVMGLIAFFMMKSGSARDNSFIYFPLFVFWLPAALYYLASLTPSLLLKNEANNGETSKIAGFIAGLASRVQGTTYYNVTKNASGAVISKSADGHMALLQFVFQMGLYLIVALLALPFAFLNYLRNYVLYF